MADELTFYTHPMSRGRIVRWMLEEVGQPYRTELLEYGGSMKGPEYLAVNPMGKVPAIKHGDVIVTEAAAICAYLADAFPDAGLAPPPAARGDYYRWLFFSAASVEYAITNRSLGVVVPPERKMSAGYGSYEDAIDCLERAVDGRTYIAGGSFSAADVIVGSQIGWGMMFGLIDKRPAFERYWAGLADRPARVRADGIDNALMPEGAGVPDAS